MPGCLCVSSLALGYDLLVILNRRLLVLDRLIDRRLQLGHCVGFVLHCGPVVRSGLVERCFGNVQRFLRHADGFLGVLEVCGIFCDLLLGAGTRRRRVRRDSGTIWFENLNNRAGRGRWWGRGMEKGGGEAEALRTWPQAGRSSVA